MRSVMRSESLKSTCGVDLETYLQSQFCTSCGTGLYGTHKTGPLRDQAGVNVCPRIKIFRFTYSIDM